MKIITDLHIHSKYSRACSSSLTLQNINAWAKTKGINVIGTGDFTHPAWFASIKKELIETEPGLFSLRQEFSPDTNYASAPIPTAYGDSRFILTSEVACMYKKNGRGRRLHLLIFAPSIVAVEKIISALQKRNINIKSDGRPIMGMDSKDLASLVFEADPRCMVVPAHAWTPWFSVFGSASGFETLEECFEELTPNIFAIETGLSSDPKMNRALSRLDNISLISNSDAHSLQKLGREANIFDVDKLSYDSIVLAIKNKKPAQFLKTIEFFPEEGKYYVAGHRACEFFCEPDACAKLNGICPKCGRGLTAGVLGRVYDLADRKLADSPTIVPYVSIIPLVEVIADALSKTVISKIVGVTYAKAIREIGSEFHILLDASISQIKAVLGEEMANSILKMRTGQVEIRPGYDGLFGQIKIK